VGAIVGGVVGGALLLLLVCGCVLFVTRRRRRRAKSSPEITRSNSPHLDDKSAKDVYLSPPGPYDSLSSPASPKAALAVDSGGELTCACIADARPIATSAPESAIDNAPADGLCSISVPNSHKAPQGQTTASGVHVLDGSPVTRQDVQVIGVHTGADHIGTTMSELCTPLREQPAALGFVQGHEIIVPTLERAIESAPLEAENSDVAIPHAHHISQELIGGVVPREQLQIIAPVLDLEVAEGVRSIPDPYGALQAQPTVVDVLDGHPVLSQQDVQAIDIHEDVRHVGTAISDVCYPPQERSTVMECIQGHEMTVPTVELAIKSAPLEADVPMSHEYHPTEELISRAEPREELLTIAPALELGIFEDEGRCFSDGRELGFVSVSIINPCHVSDNIIRRPQISDVATEAPQPEAEQVGNLLAKLYIEESPSVDVVHDDSANLQTVSQAEAEAVQTLLVSDARDRVIMPMARRVSRSSLPYIETRKAPVSEDIVSLYWYAEKNSCSLGVVHRSSA